MVALNFTAAFQVAFVNDYPTSQRFTLRHDLTLGCDDTASADQITVFLVARLEVE